MKLYKKKKNKLKETLRTVFWGQDRLSRLMTIALVFFIIQTITWLLVKQHDLWSFRSLFHVILWCVLFVGILILRIRSSRRDR